LAAHYVDDEQQLASQAQVGTEVILAHWEKLHLLRLGFQQLEQRGRLRQLRDGQRVTLRHRLAQLLGGSLQPDVQHDDTASERLREAQAQHQEDLHTIARVAQNAFDFDLPTPTVSSSD
jgi:hypothetical protein